MLKLVALLLTFFVVLINTIKLDEKDSKFVQLIQQNNQLIIQNDYTQLIFDLLRPSISSLSSDFDGNSNFG